MGIKAFSCFDGAALLTAKGQASWKPYRWCDDWEWLLKVDLHRPLLDRALCLLAQVLCLGVDRKPTVRYSEAEISCVYLLLCTRQIYDSAPNKLVDWLFHYKFVDLPSINKRHNAAARRLIEQAGAGSDEHVPTVASMLKVTVVPGDGVSGESLTSSIFPAAPSHCCQSKAAQLCSRAIQASAHINLFIFAS